jgi:hypothetical protein
MMEGSNEISTFSKMMMDVVVVVVVVVFVVGPVLPSLECEV